MLSIREKVDKNYKDYPLSERNKIIEIEFEEEEYIKIEQFVNIHNISVEEYIFMVLIDKLNESILVC